MEILAGIDHQKPECETQNEDGSKCGGTMNMVPSVPFPCRTGMVSTYHSIYDMCMKEKSIPGSYDHSLDKHLGSGFCDYKNEIKAKAMKKMEGPVDTWNPESF
tara:strand:+ start:162 stop:470 length:309 start_codon:yes stop_codon:yes gene_type:complete